MKDLNMKGIYKLQHIRNGVVIDEWTEDNLVVDEGLNYSLDVALSAGSALTSWYIALFKNNYTPTSTNVAATFFGSGVANEVTTEYTEVARQAWTEAGVSAKTITNSASPTVFTFNTSVTVYGAALVSNATKGSTSGTLMSASKFSSSRAMLSGDQLTVTYTLTASSV